MIGYAECGQLSDRYSEEWRSDECRLHFIVSRKPLPSFPCLAGKFAVLAELSAVGGSGDSEISFKGSCEDGWRRKTAIHRDFGNGATMLVHKQVGSFFDPNSMDEVARALADQALEDTVKMEWGVVGDLRELDKGHFTIEMAINVIHYGIYFRDILFAAHPGTSISRSELYRRTGSTLHGNSSIIYRIKQCKRNEQEEADSVHLQQCRHDSVNWCSYAGGG